LTDPEEPEHLFASAFRFKSAAMVPDI
jgi:hypothetical protein